MWAFILAFSTYVYADTFTMEVSRKIDFPAKMVFACLSDARNDIHWRDEVHSIIAEGPLSIGQIFFEDAKLGIHEHYFTKTSLVHLEEGRAYYETTSDNPFFLSSERLVEEMDDDRTRVTYKVIVEEDMLWDILGKKIPVFIAKTAYKERMKSYLRIYDKKKKTLGSCGTSPGRAQE